VTAKARQVEDAYPLAPIQQGLLYHALQSPEEGVFLAQYTCVLLHLEMAPFEAAWQQVVDRHPVLRTAFVWKQVDRPLQVVGRDVGLPIEHSDWRQVPPPERDERLERFLRDDRRRGFDPSRAPLMRLALIRIADDSWRLVWTFHHLILDGWCRSVLLREVFQIYAGHLGGRLPALEAPLPYRRYVAWLQEQDGAAAETFWRRTLAGFRSPTPLPREWGVEPAGDGYGSLEAFLDEATTHALGEMARSNRLTLNTVAQGAWALLLARLTGERDVVYGAVVSGRPAELEGVERMIGVFINTLPMRVSVSPGVRLLPWLQDLQDRLAEMRHYEHSALVEVQKLADLPQGTPLFESILAFENFPFEAADAGESHDVALEVEDVRSIARNAYPLAWAVSPGPRLHLRLFHDRRRFAESTVRGILERYGSLLGEMAARPTVRLDELPMLTAAELRQVVEEWGAGEALPLPDGCVHHRFVAEAARRPEAPAVIGEDAAWSHRELDEWSNRLAHRLRQLGVGPEVPVALLLPRGAWMVAAILAVWKAGGAYVPLDDDLPRQRLEAMIGDCGARVLVSRGDRLEAIFGAERPAPATVLVDPGAGLETMPATPPPDVSDPDHLAYVLFTSGSTGRPKGVAVEHRQLSHYADAARRRLGVPAAASYALVSSFAADLGNTSLLLALTSGGCLHVCSAETARDPGALADRLERQPVDVMKIVPSHLEALTEGGRAKALLPRRTLVLGGEAANPERLADWRRRAPGCAFFNHYGPTESTVGVVAGLLDAAERGPLPLGTVLARVRCYVVDPMDQPLPAGVAGELWIGGDGVARGYHGLAAATADRFRPDPWSPRPGARVYRTGDRVCWLPDGRLLFIGRTDLQVKVRGYRVELAEVERAIEQHRAVRKAVVAARRSGEGPAGLDAYVVPVDPRLADAGALRDALHELPDGQAVFQLNRNETRHLYEQIYQDGIYLRHGVALEDDACVVDVGANVGMFTIWAHRMSRGARIFAFEPGPAAFARLALNAALYGLDVEAFQCGVSDRDGSATFTFYPRASIMSGFYADEAEEEAVFRGYMQAHGQVSAYAAHAEELAEGRFAGETVDCPLRSLSSVIREHGLQRIDLLKVDAEKAEMDIFAGLDDEHWPLVRQVTAEVHEVGDRLEEVQALLRRHGFVVHLEQDATLLDTGIHHLYAYRPQGAGRQDSAREPRRLEAVDTHLAAADLAASLAAGVEALLPDFMRPRSFTLLEALPMLPSGKVDRTDLPDPPAPGEARRDAYVGPRSPLEEKLAGIWAEVLKVERVGVEDDFFRLGGDSILNIQIVARCLRAGVKVSPGLLFRHPTVARLAVAVEGQAAPGPTPAAGPSEGAVERPADRGEPQGEVPLTPVQRWFFERAGDAPHHFNMPVFLAVHKPLDPGRLLRALRALGAHHDALRLRYERRDGSGWRQFYAAEPPADVLACIDLSALPAHRRAEALASAAARAQRIFDLSRGPLLRGVMFELGEGEAARLLLLAHHLVVDGVSWRILLEDLESAYRRFTAGAADAGLPRRSDSFQRWAAGLVELAASPAMEEARRYWLRFAEESLPPLPVDLAGGDNTFASMESVTVRLDADTTRALLTEVPATYATRIHEVLLAALVEASAGLTGSRRLAVEVEGHGREDVVHGVDVSRTVGWFTSHYPLLLDVEGATGVGQALKRVKEQVRSLPMAGLGHGLLRYLSPDRQDAERLEAAPAAEIRFNYLGQLDQALAGDSAFEPAIESVGPSADPRLPRSHLLDVTGAVSNRTLEVVWRFSRDLHTRETIKGLADRYVNVLTEIVDHCRRPETGGYTPSDFPDAGLSQQGLDNVVAQLGVVLDR
jgi:amino acid adenylation domain-containing protein/non-ribosomal peptide synthase protein (TIGR01720 family)/FkbM family methyltransferase